MTRLLAWIIAFVFVILVAGVLVALWIVELFNWQPKRHGEDTASLIAASRKPSLVRKQAD